MGSKSEKKGNKMTNRVNALCATIISLQTIITRTIQKINWDQICTGMKGAVR